jgi:hypothetical protein
MQSLLSSTKLESTPDSTVETVIGSVKHPLDLETNLKAVYKAIMNAKPPKQDGNLNR